MREATPARSRWRKAAPVRSWWRDEAEEEKRERGGSGGGGTTASEEHELREVSAAEGACSQSMRDKGGDAWGDDGEILKFRRW